MFLWRSEEVMIAFKDGSGLFGDGGVAGSWVFHGAGLLRRSGLSKMSIYVALFLL